MLPETRPGVFFDALGGKRDGCIGCILGEPTRRRPVLLVAALPRRPAVRRPAPTRPLYVRVLDSTGYESKIEEPPIFEENAFHFPRDPLSLIFGSEEGEPTLLTILAS